MCVHRAVLLWGTAFPSCHNSSSRKQTQAGTALASSHHHNMRNTQGAKRARLPPCLLPASSCSLSHAPQSTDPLQEALASMIMASLPHGNIHPEYPDLIFSLPQGMQKLRGERSSPGEGASPPARLVKGNQTAGKKRTWLCCLFCSRPQSCRCGLRGPRAEQLWAEGY